MDVHAARDSVQSHTSIGPGTFDSLILQCTGQALSSRTLRSGTTVRAIQWRIQFGFHLVSEVTTYSIQMLSLTWHAVYIQRWTPTLEVRQHHLFLSALRGTVRSVLCSCQTSGVRLVPEFRLPLMGLSGITCPSSSTECNERSSAFPLYQTGQQPTLCCRVSSQL